MSPVSYIMLRDTSRDILLLNCCFLFFSGAVYILKENGAKIVQNLETLSRRTEFLIGQGTQLRQDVKKRKVEVMTQIDENFEKIIHMILQKRAEVKLKYAEAL